MEIAVSPMLRLAIQSATKVVCARASFVKPATTTILHMLHNAPLQNKSEPNRTTWIPMPDLAYGVLLYGSSPNLRRVLA